MGHTGRSASRAVLATSRLRQALDSAADSLAHGRVDTLLASEGALEFALADMPPMNDLSADERASLRVELEGAERALLRCRRLGATLTEYVRLTLASQTPAAGPADYAPGRRDDADYGGRAVNARV
jgi:hypothetical protein